MPLVSIIVPACGTAPLEATLRSLRAQTLRDHEILVVGDRPAAALAETIADPRIRLIAAPRSSVAPGRAAARNAGIAAARGAYLGFCDAGDLWAPGKLAAHLAHFAGAPRLAVSVAGSAPLHAPRRAAGPRRAPRAMDAAALFRRMPVADGSCAVVRRAALAPLAFRPAAETERDWIFDETLPRLSHAELWLRLKLLSDWDVAGLGAALSLRGAPALPPRAEAAAQLEGWTRMVARLSPVAPAFFARHTPAARAHLMAALSRDPAVRRHEFLAARLAREACRAPARVWATAPLRLAAAALQAAAAPCGRPGLSALPYEGAAA